MQIVFELGFRLFCFDERSEIVVLVQVAREIVFKQDTALHRAVAVLCAYIVDCFSSLSALSFGSSKRLICTPSLFSSLIADTVIARRGSLKLCIFQSDLSRILRLRPNLRLPVKAEFVLTSIVKLDFD